MDKNLEPGLAPFAAFPSHGIEYYAEPNLVLTGFDRGGSPLRESDSTQVIFFSAVADERDRQQVRMLIDSIRSFAGPLKDSPVWIFDISPGRDLCGRMAADGVETFLLPAKPSLTEYLYGGKVAACARAEDMVSGEISSLVWASPDTLILDAPLGYQLRPPFKVALRPVHVQNVGAPVERPLNAYWQAIYQAVDLEEPSFSVTSFIDQVKLYPYFNSHTFAVKPGLGLLKRWQEVFQSLAGEESFQNGPCRPRQRKIFLHQAVLSACVTAELEESEIYLLPEEYSYPYNLHSQVPRSRRRSSLDTLVSMTWEGRTLDPAAVGDIELGDAFATWLERYYA